MSVDACTLIHGTSRKSNSDFEVKITQGEE
jgi:hypothetical protein